jgi:hypothetical protein
MIKVLTKISTQESSQVNNYLIAQRKDAINELGIKY